MALLFTQYHYGRALRGGTPEERSRGWDLLKETREAAQQRGVQSLQRRISFKA
jgi:hypothetical protein